jgi:hypothetical protein
LNSVVLELNALLAALLQHLHTHAYAMTGEGLGRKPFIRIVCFVDSSPPKRYCSNFYEELFFDS